MCNLNKITKRRSQIVYKVVRVSLTGEFISCFANSLVDVGNVAHLNSLSKERMSTYLPTDFLFNRLAVDRCSGFERLSAAKDLLGSSHHSNEIIVRIELGGVIVKGDALDISDSVDPECVIYAGTEIISVTEIKSNLP